MGRRLATGLLAVACLLLWACGVPSSPTQEELAARARAGDAEAVAALVERLGRTATREERTLAYRTLLETGRGNAGSILDACRDPDPLRREHALALAANLRLPGAFEEAVRSLSDTEFARRYVAAWALGELGGEGAVHPLLAALRRDKGEVARTAARSLIKLGSGAVPALLDALPELDPEAKGYVIRALGDIGDGRAATALTSALSEPGLRADAAWALGKLARPETGAALRPHLQDPDWRVRLEVVRALGLLQVDAADADLDRMRESDPVPAVREWSARSLALLRGTVQTYRTAAGQWAEPDQLYR